MSINAISVNDPDISMKTHKDSHFHANERNNLGWSIPVHKIQNYMPVIMTFIHVK